MPGATRARSSNGAESANKKARTNGNGPAANTVSSSTLASLHIPSAEVVQQYTAEYAKAEPYKYAAISGLIDDELVRYYPSYPTLAHTCEKRI